MTRMTGDPTEPDGDVSRETSPPVDVSRETSCASDGASPDESAVKGSVSRETSGAAVVFGARLAIARRYADLLATVGVARGLIGPRERSRLWTRHLLNSAALAELIGPDLEVCDVGSGAGLPGVPLAIARPDLKIELLEPMQRRATFLAEVVATLELERVRVTRARAEDLAGSARADVVVARAVAPLHRLCGWCLPLLRPGGTLLALKGDRAREELTAAERQLHALGAQDWGVVECGDAVAAPATVARVVATMSQVRGDMTVPRRRGTKGAR